MEKNAFKMRSLKIKLYFKEVLHSDLFCVINNKLIIVQGVSTGVVHSGVFWFSQRHSGPIWPVKRDNNLINYRRMKTFKQIMSEVPSDHPFE